MTLAHDHRFAGKPDHAAERTDVREHRFTPDTLAQYRDLVLAYSALTRLTIHAQAIADRFKEMPARFRGELTNTIPGIEPLDLGDGLAKLKELSGEFEAGLDEWERFS